MSQVPVTPYGVAIHDAISSGDLARMRQIQQQAVEHLKQTGDVSAALEVLKIEIAKLEGANRRQR